MRRKGLVLFGVILVVATFFLFIIATNTAAYADLLDEQGIIEAPDANEDCDASWYIGSVNGNEATVVMTPDTHFACDVYLTSWEMYDPLPNTGTQVKFAQKKKVSPPGGSTPITFSIAVPDCAWQVDLSSVPVDSASDYNGHNLIAFDFGGGALCGGGGPVCGDGDVQGGEQCELPDTANNNYCGQTTSQCSGTKLGVRDAYGNCNSVCGCVPDNFVYSCVKNQCGAECAVAADCNDGNPNTNDVCLDGCTCQHTQLPYCGNGITDPGEQCDDGNQNPADQCSNSCTITYCPDGIVQNPNGQGGYEYCDDGNQNNNDLCSNICMTTYCGDGYVQNPNGWGQNEQCDDFNTQDGDGCSSQCQLECLINITKTDSPDPVAHNGTLKYTVRAKNYGTSTCNESVIVKETYDNRTTFLSAVPSPTSGNNIWNFSTILPGKFKEINITVKVNATANCGSLTNKACATKGTAQNTQVCDIEPTNVTCAPPVIYNCTDAVKFGLLKGSIVGNVGYVTNYANQTFEVGMASYKKFDEIIDHQQIYDWESKNISAFSNITLSVDLPVCAHQIDVFCGPVLMSLNGTRYGPRLLAAKHSSGLPYCQGCLMNLTKTDSPDPVAPDGKLNYTLRLRNVGNADCTGGGVLLKEYYSNYTTFLSAVPAPTSGNNLWNFGTMHPGAMREVNISMKVKSSTPYCDVIKNKACFWTAEYNAWTCVYENTSTTCPSCKLELTKKDKPDPVASGGLLNYTLLIKNIDDGKCDNVKIKEFYDNGTVFVSSVPAPTSGNNFWNFGTLNPGDSKEINITMSVVARQCTNLTNVASFWATQYGTWTNVTEKTNILCDNLFCGDGIVTPPETCELPNTTDNKYCEQKTQTCLQNKTGTRDEFGACDGTCGCSYDPFVYQCVQGQCGATCDSPEDYNLSAGICHFGCSDNSCSYTNSCSTGEYCGGLNNNTYFYNGLCSGQGCSFTSTNCDDSDTRTNITFCINEQIVNKTFFNDFSCAPGGCTNTTTINTTLIIDCNSLDGWYNTTETRWITNTICTEKEQLKQLYRNYTCSAYNETNCSFSITGEQWIDTGSIRNVPDGTACSDELFCNGGEYCSVGQCIPGPPVVCNDNNTCTSDYCDEQQDRCVYIPTGNGTANVTKVYGDPFFFNGTSEWINSSTIITMTASTDACFLNLSILYRVTLMDNSVCYSDTICQASNGTGSWHVYNGTFTINETSCHLIEFFANGSAPTPIKKQCPFVDNSGPIPNKTVGEPSDKIYPATYNWTFYPWVNGKCWTGNESIDCWKVTTMTPVTLDCNDQQPHPVDHSRIWFNVDFDGTNITDQYCNELGGFMSKINGYCMVEEENTPITLYFHEESEHNLKYYCEDALGNDGPIDDEKFKVEGKKFVINLNKKWNLISVPFVLFNNSPSYLFGPVAADIQSVWMYDSQTGLWHVYTPDGIDNDDLTDIEPGVGYWVLALHNTTLIIDGSLFNPAQTPPSQPVTHGWNLLGYYGNQNETGGEFFNYTGPVGNGKTAACALYSLGNSVFDKGYTAVFTYWEPYNPDPYVPLNSYDRMDPGAGYWVFATENTIYSPTTICPA